MTLADYEATYTGRSMLYAPTRQREVFRSQCVQPIMFYVTQVWGLQPMWCDYAFQWFTSGLLSDQYDRIANNFNDPNQIPPVGAVIVFGSNSPGSAGGGHICINLEANTTTFTSLDSNWGTKTLRRVVHNYNYVIGWLVPKGTAPAIVTERNEMITSADQAAKMYAMLRPNQGGSQGEIDDTAGHRSYEQFVNDAQNEIAERNTAIANLHATIEQLRQADIADQQRIAQLTAELADMSAKLQTVPVQSAPEPEKVDPPKTVAQPKGNLFIKLLAAIFAPKE